MSSTDVSTTEEPLPQPGPGAKMMFLIRRRAGASREELLMHWFANHMPGVIRAQQQATAAGRSGAWRYIATVFDGAAFGAAGRAALQGAPPMTGTAWRSSGGTGRCRGRVSRSAARRGTAFRRRRSPTCPGRRSST